MADGGEALRGVASAAVAAARPHALPFRGVDPGAGGGPRLTDSTTVEQRETSQGSISHVAQRLHKAWCSS